MRPRRAFAPVGIALVLLPLLGVWSACPGDLPTAHMIPERGWSSGVDGTVWPRSDKKPISMQDVRVAHPDRKGPTVVPDLNIMPPDKPTIPNGTCPCPPTQQCLNNKCYNKCVAQGGCGVDSACAATEVCILITNMAVWACMNATAAPGGVCNELQWCPNHYVCIYKTIGAASGTCQAQCTQPGAACAGGGVCQLYQTCAFCSTP